MSIIHKKNNPNIWINLKEIHKKGSHYDWENSIDCKIEFSYEGYRNYFIIKSYDKKTHDLYLMYNNEIHLLKYSSLMRCNFKKVIRLDVIIWAYNIGDVIKDENRNLVIINRKYEIINGHVKKYYQYSCCKCGFSCGEHYWNNEYKNEFWVLESSLFNSKQGCSCCCNFAIVPGINDIPTTDSWMIKYFQGGYEEAKMYSAKSTRKIHPICPDCKTIKSNKVIIGNIYKSHSVSCQCSDKISYPNKFSYSLLKQLNVDNHVIEYIPKWIKPYRYDNYFEYQGVKYILEMDGGLGHGKVSFASSEQDMVGICRDDYKNQKAQEYNIKIIRIDCNYGQVPERFEYIKQNILNSDLNIIFDLSKINWEECDEFACSNLVKEISLFWEKHKSMSVIELCQKYKVSECTLRNYLKIGAKNNWCSYDSVTNFVNDRSKIIHVYDKNKNYLFEYKGEKTLGKNSLSILGIKISYSSIRKCCRHETDFCKGYKFRYSNDDELYENNNNKHEGTA